MLCYFGYILLNCDNYAQSIISHAHGRSVFPRQQYYGTTILLPQNSRSESAHEQ